MSHNIVCLHTPLKEDTKKKGSLTQSLHTALTEDTKKKGGLTQCPITLYVSTLPSHEDTKKMGRLTQCPITLYVFFTGLFQILCVCRLYKRVL